MSIWGSIAGALIGVGGNLLGSKIGGESVEQGNQALIAAIAKGQELALEEIRLSKEQAFGFLDRGRQATLDLLAPLLISGAAGEGVLRREALADPGVLTSAQQRGLDEAQRVSRNQLATSGLRGAGRTQAAVLKDVTGNFISEAQETNRSRALAAADRLFGTGAAARTGAANTEFGTGTAKAGAATGAGTDAARVIENASRAIGGAEGATGKIIGGLRGGAIVDSGRVVGETLGTIAGQMANERKTESAFKNFRPNVL